MGRFSKLEKNQVADPSMPTPAPLPAAQGPSPFDASAFSRKGDECFFNGDYRDALRDYSKALQSASNSPYPWIAQVLCMVMLGQHKEAELWARRALDSFPEDPGILSVHGVALACLGMVKRGIGVSDFALTKGANAFVWMTRGMVLLKARNDNAGACFLKMLEQPDLDWRLLFWSGLALEEAKDFATALDYYQKACAINDTLPYLWTRVGTCCVRLAYMDRATTAFRRALTLKPGFKPAERALADMGKGSIIKLVSGVFRRR